VVPEWERLTAHIEADPESKEKLGWVREMYAFSVATALAGLRLDMQPPPGSPLIAQPPADKARPRRLIWHCNQRGLLPALQEFWEPFWVAACPSLQKHKVAVKPGKCGESFAKGSCGWPTQGMDRFLWGTVPQEAGEAAMLHYTWGTVIKDSFGRKLWEFDKRTYTAEEIQRKVGRSLPPACMHACSAQSISRGTPIALP
jgi:hypothetical protein